MFTEDQKALFKLISVLMERDDRWWISSNPVNTVCGDLSCAHITTLQCVGV